MKIRSIVPGVLCLLAACKQESPSVPRPVVVKTVEPVTTSARDASQAVAVPDVVALPRENARDAGPPTVDAARPDASVAVVDAAAVQDAGSENDAGVVEAGVPRVEYSGDAGAASGVVGPTTRGFAGISADGKTLVVTVLGTGPLSGSELTVVFLDAHTGAVRRRLPVVNHDESEAMEGEVSAAIIARLHERVAATNTALEALHPHSLPAFVEGEHEDDQGTAHASGQGWTVTSASGELSVRRGDATTPVLVHRTLPPMTGGTRECKSINVPRVRGFHVIADDRLLVQVAYHGTDLCWEQPDVWLVITVPTAPAP